jgi:hypothetical protein
LLLGSEREELFVCAEGVLDDIVVALPGSQVNQEIPEDHLMRNALIFSCAGLLSVLAGWGVAFASPDSVVVFNEIHYNPVGQSEDGEWIELFNQMGIQTDLSGWRIEGIGYTFPARSFIAPGGYLVVAKTPELGQLGPFTGSLENGGERLRLINRGERLMDELSYGDDGRWPDASDGSGVTLAKRNPYSANKPPENWTAAAQVNGTPGEENFPAPLSESPVLINEMPSASGDPFWVELVNVGAADVELDGMILTAGADPLRRYVIPAQVLASGDLLLLTELELGFRPLEGEKLFLYQPSESVVADARELTGSLRGRAEERGGDYLYPVLATPGLPNSFSFHDEVVISEIMYNPPPLPTPAGSTAMVQNSDNQWIEIANRSAAPIALAGWEFNDGVSFTFPAEVSLAVGEHACIVRDALAFAEAYPGARILGEFRGSLSRSGERIHLRDQNKNPVDEVRYFDSGRWPEIPDGGGASLELRDLDADNSVAESWAASDETAQGAWRSYAFQGTAAASRGPDSKWSEFNLGLLDAGEILIDDLRVVENRSLDKIRNMTFSSGATGWRFRGTHRHSEIIDDPDDPGNKVLRLVATGGTGHMHNQIETTLLSPVRNGQNYAIRFRARWVSGSNQLHTRFYFNRLARVTLIDRPQHVGTPSAPNSRAESNIGPSITETIHAPAVPAVGQAVTISARATDPDDVLSMKVFYSVDGRGFQNVSMSMGAGGVYQGTIPGRGAAALVQFYLEATDSFGATAHFPAAGPESRALFKVDDGLAATNGQHNFRIVVTNAERDFIHESIQVMSNDRIGATIIDREEDIYYDVRLRLKGSQRARNQDNRVGYNMRFGNDQLYRGIHKSMAIDRSEGVGQGQLEILFDFMIANSGGVISRYYDFIKVLAPKNQHTRSAVLQMARYDDVLLDSQFENGSDGNLYEYELLYTPNNADANGYKLPNPDGVTGATVGNLGDDKEQYRWFFLKKNNREADDFGPIIAYNKKFSQSGAAFEDGLEEVVDIDAWLRGMAYAVLSGAGDNAGANSQHNGMYYAHPDGRVMFLPHDMDFSFSTTRSIFANSQCARLTADPTRKRIYLGHLLDIITTTYNRRSMQIWTRHLQILDASQPWSSHLNYMDSRSNNVRSQINAQIAAVNFSITTGSPLTVGTSSATVSGVGWVNVREIRQQGGGASLPLTWSDGDSWRVDLPLIPGMHAYTLEALDFSGEVISADTITINNTSVIPPASEQTLVITEISYRPEAPDAAEEALGFDARSDFEFVELMNISSGEIDLFNVRFTDGIDFNFTDSLVGAALGAGERLVIVNNLAAFSHRYPSVSASTIAGEFSGKLNDDGELLILLATDESVIRSVSYQNLPPWPAAADGQGPSLVLINPAGNPDHGDPLNWRASVSAGGNPNATDATSFLGVATADSDSNGIPDLIDYLLGNQFLPDLEHPGGGMQAIEVGGLTADYFTFSFRRSLAADDVLESVEASADLETWNSGPGFAEYHSTVNRGDGTATVTWRSNLPIHQSTALYFRLRADLR